MPTSLEEEGRAKTKSPKLLSDKSKGHKTSKRIPVDVKDTSKRLGKVRSDDHIASRSLRRRSSGEFSRDQQADQSRTNGSKPLRRTSSLTSLESLQISSTHDILRRPSMTRISSRDSVKETADPLVRRPSITRNQRRDSYTRSNAVWDTQYMPLQKPADLIPANIDIKIHAAKIAQKYLKESGADDLHQPTRKPDAPSTDIEQFVPNHNLKKSSPKRDLEQRLTNDDAGKSPLFAKQQRRSSDVRPQPTLRLSKPRRYSTDVALIPPQKTYMKRQSVVSGKSSDYSSNHDVHSQHLQNKLLDLLNQRRISAIEIEVAKSEEWLSHSSQSHSYTAQSDCDEDSQSDSQEEGDVNNDFVEIDIGNSEMDSKIPRTLQCEVAVEKQKKSKRKKSSEKQKKYSKRQSTDTTMYTSLDPEDPLIGLEFPIIKSDAKKSGRKRSLAKVNNLTNSFRLKLKRRKKRTTVLSIAIIFVAMAAVSVAIYFAVTRGQCESFFLPIFLVSF